MASTRKFGVTSNLSGLQQGIVVNSINHSFNTESAEARDQAGRIIDIAVYGKTEQISIDGLTTTEGDQVGAGDIIAIGGKNYLVTTVSNNESNTAFETANVNARWSEDAELWPLSACVSGANGLYTWDAEKTVNSGKESAGE